jgi:hypothetical protein
MQQDTGGHQESRWLIEPPDPDSVQFSLSVGEAVEVTEALREAIDRLLSSFHTPEVQGFARCFPQCADLNGCGSFHCVPLNNCRFLYRYPCAMRMDCQIKRI